MKPDKCKECPLYTAPGPTPAQGDPQSVKLIYIIDKPSEKDGQIGGLLSDGIGSIFNRQLYEAGIPRSEVLVTSLIKCVCKDPSVFAQAASHCRRFLDRELERTKADTVVLAGQAAFDAFIGRYSTYSSLIGRPYIATNKVNARMGCVEQRDDRKWIGLPHPSEFMRQVIVKDEIIMHLQKAARIAGQKLPLPQVHKDFSDKQLDEVQHVILNTVKAFADDVETHQMSDVEEDDYVGGDYEVDLVGVSIGLWQAAVFKPEQTHLFEDVYQSPDVWNYQHNGMYDQYHISKLIGWHKLYKAVHQRYNPWMDGMLAAHYHKSFKFKYLKPDCLSRYTDLPYYDRKIEQVDRKFYNGLDVIATHQECIRLTQLLKDQGSWDTFMSVGMPLLPILEEERVKGCRVDIRKVFTFRKIIEAKIEKAQSIAKTITAGMDPFNPHTLKTLLYEFWKLPVQKNKRKSKDKDGIVRVKETVSTDYEARKRVVAFIEDPAHPERREQYKLARHLITLVDYEAGEAKKLEYLDRVDPDFRIHAYYKAHGQRTLRLSSTPNLQNFPVYDICDWGGARAVNKKSDDPLGFERPVESLGSLRSIITADDDDDLLLTCDLDQVQIWVYAQIAGVKWLKDIHASGDYIYGGIYEKLYKEAFFIPGGRTKKFMRKDVPQQRIRRAKAVPLGFLFGRTAQAVAQEYGWTLAEANELRKWWFDNCPELLKHYAQTEYDVKQKGYIKTPYGIILWFPEGKVNDAINAHAQNGEAMIIGESKVLIDKEFKRRGWKNTRLMLSVHDSITMNIAGARTNPQHMVEVYEEIVAPILSRSNPHYGNFPFKHSAEVSFMWDWDVEVYDKWKARVFGDGNTTVSGRTDQSHPATA